MSNFTRRRRIIVALCSSPSLVVPVLTRAQAPFEPREGTNYTVLAIPQPAEGRSEIAVLDFFWYGCPHCFALLPELETWRKRLASDVLDRHVPVDFGDPRREPHTRIFCALQSLDRVEEMHVKVFGAIHTQGLRLLDRDEIADFMAGNGIARDKWLAAYDSFTVAGSVERMRLTTRAYGVDGVPTIAVDGRFLTSPAMAQGQPNGGVLVVVDYLLERVRHERGRSNA